MTHDALTRTFEAERERLRGVAYRILGSAAEAEDAVQEAWLRARRADLAEITNLSGWLTTTVARIGLDSLRSHRARREFPLDAPGIDPPADPRAGGDPEREALMADAVGRAMLVVLTAMTPPERVAFVLHDVFGMAFEKIAPILERTPAATRQLASRARRRVRAAEDGPIAAPLPGYEIVNAFRAASRGGDVAALLAILASDVVVRADAVAVAMGAAAEVRGAEAVLATFVGRAQAARYAQVDGRAGLAWTPGGTLRVAFRFTIEAGRVAAIDLIADPDRLVALGVAIED